MKLKMNLHRRLTLKAIGAAGLLVLGAPLLSMGQAMAQEFPSRSIKFVVPFPPGSGTDTSARYFGKKLTELTGQPVVVENKPGANGFIAVRAVLAAPADGYTVFVGSNSTLAVNVALFKSLPYDPLTDLAPLTMMMRAPALLVTPASGSHTTLNDLVAAAKAGQAQLRLGLGWLPADGRIVQRHGRRADAPCAVQGCFGGHDGSGLGYRPHGLRGHHRGGRTGQGR